MKPQLTESEKFELEMIEREIRQSKFETRIYTWVVMPAMFGMMAWYLYSGFTL